MPWPALTFGRNAGSTLPQIMLADPDWAFWAEKNGVLRSTVRVRDLLEKSRQIRIPDGPRGPRVADYVAHGNGKLSHLEIGYSSEMKRDEDSGVWRRGYLDLGFARFVARGSIDRMGSMSIVAAIRRYVFLPMGWTRLTAERCAAFFDDDANFVL